VSRRAELDAFLGWLLGTSNQSAATSFGTSRSFRRRTWWCWNIAPETPVTGEVHDQIQVDEIYVGSWRCLITVAWDHVLGWQWCDTEKKAAWAALLARFPGPTVVVTDGGSGIAAALSERWGETAVQRCRVHVQRNVRTHPPDGPAQDCRGQGVAAARAGIDEDYHRGRSRDLAGGLNDWHQSYGHLVKARTYRTGSAVVPGWVRTNQTW
jgi:mutator family transposase